MERKGLCPPVCWRPGCTYKVQCLACKKKGPDTVLEKEQGGGRRGQGKVGVPCFSLYHGETGCSAYVRGLDHKYKEHKRQTNFMVRHSKVYHFSREVVYQMSGVSTHKEPVSRRRGGHCRRQPDHPLPLQGGVSPWSSTQHKDW